MRVWKPVDTPNFSREEMACKCGNCDGEAPMDGDFMEKLQHIRDLLGRSVTITSGYRCPQHPEEAKKPKAGAHSAGLAADIAVSGGKERYEIVHLAMNSNMKGIGVANTFIHVDDGHPHADRPVVYKY